MEGVVTETQPVKAQTSCRTAKMLSSLPALPRPHCVITWHASLHQGKAGVGDPLWKSLGWSRKLDETWGSSHPVQGPQGKGREAQYKTKIRLCHVPRLRREARAAGSPPLTAFKSHQLWKSSQKNHRMVGVGRNFCGSSSPTPLPKQGHLQ